MKQESLLVVKGSLSVHSGMLRFFSERQQKNPITSIIFFYPERNIQKRVIVMMTMQARVK